MKRSLWKRFGYNTFKYTFWIMARVLFRFRWRGGEHFPQQSGALICSNHQSFFDPILIGICFPHRLNFLARQTLFDSRLFGGVIRYLDAIPINREGMSLGGIKESLKRLKRGEMLALFPEGTRTNDGTVKRLKPGFITLARRAKVPILPAAVDGAYDAWPRDAKFPRLTKLRTVFGPCLSAEQIAELSDEELVETLHGRIVDCHRQARQLRGIDVEAE